MWCPTHFFALGSAGQILKKFLYFSFFRYILVLSCGTVLYLVCFLFLFFRYILVLSQPSVWHENKVLVFLFFARMKASFSIDSFIVIDSYVNTKHFNMILLSNCLWVLVWASVCVFSALLCACFNSFSPIYALLTKKNAGLTFTHPGVVPGSPPNWFFLNFFPFNF